ncbi:MAG: SOS response-associated peptidase [Kiloniellales bacterium]
MCGRYSLTTPVEAVGRLFAVAERPNLPPRYNIAPSQEAPVVRTHEAGGRGLALMCWGLIPSWAKEARVGYKMINARAETVAQKPAFRTALRHRRCLVPADGFYEWRKLGKLRQPYRITLTDGGPFAFAGLWERWRAPDRQLVESFTIITTEANRLLRPIHDRMPVILDAADYEAWLDTGGIAPDEAARRLRPYPAAGLAAFPISTRINSPRNDDPACIVPLEGQAAAG